HAGVGRLRLRFLGQKKQTSYMQVRLTFENHLLDDIAVPLNSTGAARIERSLVRQAPNGFEELSATAVLVSRDLLRIGSGFVFRLPARRCPVYLAKEKALHHFAVRPIRTGIGV